LTETQLPLPSKAPNKPAAAPPMPLKAQIGPVTPPSVPPTEPNKPATPLTVPLTAQIMAAEPLPVPSINHTGAMANLRVVYSFLKQSGNLKHKVNHKY
jgi:hypothetical protein